MDIKTMNKHVATDLKSAWQLTKDLADDSISKSKIYSAKEVLDKLGSYKIDKKVDTAEQAEHLGKYAATVFKSDMEYPKNVPLFFAVKCGQGMGIYSLQDYHEFIKAISDMDNPVYSIFADIDSAIAWMNLPMKPPFNYRRKNWFDDEMWNGFMYDYKSADEDRKKLFHEHSRDAASEDERIIEMYRVAQLSSKLKKVDPRWVALTSYYDAIDDDTRYKIAHDTPMYFALTGSKTVDDKIVTDRKEAKKLFKQDGYQHLNVFEFETQAELFLKQKASYKSGAWKMYRQINRLEKQYQVAQSKLLTGTDTVRNWHTYAHTVSTDDNPVNFYIVCLPVVSQTKFGYNLQLFDSDHFDKCNKFLSNIEPEMWHEYVFADHDEAVDFIRRAKKIREDLDLQDVSSDKNNAFANDVADWFKNRLNSFLIEHFAYEIPAVAKSDVEDKIDIYKMKQTELKSAGKLKRRRSKQGEMHTVNTANGEISVQNQWNHIDDDSVLFDSKNADFKLDDSRQADNPYDDKHFTDLKQKIAEAKEEKRLKQIRKNNKKK